MNISINRCCGSPRSASENSMLFYYTKVWILSEYYSNVWILAVIYVFNFFISPGKRPCKQVSILVFLYFARACNVDFEEICLYSTMLNPWLVLFRLYKTGKILQLITVAVIKFFSVSHLSSESLSELENFETGVSLKQFLQKIDLNWNGFIVDTTSPTPTNVKSISSQFGQFQLAIFLSQTYSDIFHSGRHFSVTGSCPL